MQSNRGVAQPYPEELVYRIVLGLVIPEKMGILFGSLMFIWATVVLVGGFAIMMKAIDFWFVTIIVLFLGARYIYRTSLLEMQHDEDNDGLGATYTMPSEGVATKLNRGYALEVLRDVNITFLSFVSCANSGPTGH